MFDRTATTLLRQISREYPVVTLVGPRQSGKTTLARAVFDHLPYANLEEPDTRRAAQEDGRGFLMRFPGGAVLDEFQRAPELASWIQVDADAHHGARGRWILTGSHQPAMHATLGQSLAGRTGLLTLLPLALDELASVDGRRWTLDELLVSGGYPRLHDDAIPPHRFHADYAATYLDRDVRQLVNLRQIEPFHRFLALAAGRSAQLLNRAALAGDAGVDATTVAAWLGVLEAGFIAAPLPPWFANLGKRLAKQSKLIFHDSGVASHQIGLAQPLQVATHPLRGSLFESFVIAEARKAILHRGAAARLHFYRDAGGHEVDLLVEAGGRVLAVEIKSGMTIAGDWFQPLRRLGMLPGMVVDGCMLVSAAPDDGEWHGVRCCPWWRFPAHLVGWLRRVGALGADTGPDPGTDRLDRAFSG